MIRVVGAVISNDRKEILCALRSSTMSSPNVWEFPGGKVEQNERDQEALVREIHEELGCQIKVLDDVEDTHFETSKKIIHLITYEAKLIQGEPIPKEHEQIKWVEIDQLNTLNWAPADIPTVQKITKNFLKG